MDHVGWRLLLRLAPLVFPVGLALIFALLWRAVGRLVWNRTWRLVLCLSGTILIGLTVFLIGWAWSSGS